MKNWFIVQSHSNFENKVSGLIKEEAEKAKISDKFEEIIVPTHDVTEVKQEAFKVSWPTWKETLQGALMVFVMAVVMSLFFLLLDQVLKFFLEILLKVSI